MRVRTKSAPAAVTSPDDGAQHGSFDVILSAQTRDRDGDVLKSTGWKQPLPERIPFNVDHGMSVPTMVGSGSPYIDKSGNLCVRGTFASTALGQEVRTLVKEGHLQTVSVEFITDRTAKSGQPDRELTGGGFVYLPSNREARVMSAKSAAPVDPNEPPETPETPGEAPDAEDLIETVTTLADQLPDAAPEDLPAIVDQLAQALAALAETVNAEQPAAADDPSVKAFIDELETRSLSMDLEARLAAL